MKWISLWMVISSIALGWTHVGNNIRGWKQAPVTFYLNPANCPISESELNEIVDAAILAWNGVTDSRLVVERARSSVSVSEFLAGNTTQLPIILCDTDFATQVGASGVHVIPAATFKTATDDKGNLIYSGILLNSASGAGANIAYLSKGQVELTLAHEMGHALGLGHSSQSEALMYYSLGSKQQALLTEDDLDGIVHIYPRNELGGGVMGCSAVKFPRNGEGPATHWPMLLLGLLFILGAMGWGRRASRFPF